MKAPLLVSMLLLIWHTQLGAQQSISRLELEVATGRPVAKAVEVLTERHPIVITYEDPPYEYEGDIRNVAREVWNPEVPFDPSAKVLVPVGRPLSIAYDVSPERGDPRNLRAALETIIHAQDQSGVGGRFAVEESGGAFHVYPRQIRNATGQWVAHVSILDTVITIPKKEGNWYEILGAFCDAVNAAAAKDLKLHVGVFPFRSFLNDTGTLEASNERARDVLTRLVQSASDRALTWRILYDPAGQFGYALNVLPVKGSLENELVEPQPLPLPTGPRPFEIPPGAERRPAE